MSEQLIVRRVLAVDLRAATEIFSHQTRAHGRDVEPDALRPVVQALLEDGDRTLMIGAYHEGLAGFAHGKMVGVLMMHIQQSLSAQGEVGWIEELFVRPEYRRKGLGDKMLKQALEWAAGRGLRGIDLEVGDGHELEAAQKLYSKAGFEVVKRTRLHKGA
jgi:ribosomal protein S18 acetylase RimI-like enzyme